MGAIEIREWVDTDLDVFVDITLQDDPFPDPAFLRRALMGEVSPIISRRVAAFEGRPAGLAMVVDSIAAPHWMTRIVVDTPLRRRGIGSALWNDVVQNYGQVTLGTFCPDTQDDFVEFAVHRGFEVKQHGIVSLLDAYDVPADPISCPYPIEVVQDPNLNDDAAAAADDLMSRAATNPEAVELGWEMNVAAMRRYLEHGLWVIAWDGAKAIALSNADMGEDGHWSIGYTVVDQEYRGKGLAKTLKTVLHQYGVANGAIDFRTENEERNIEIRALNRSMGYQITGGEYRLLRPGQSA